MCENCVGIPGLLGEHGFSALIERDGRKWLFDTGAGRSLPVNLEAMGADLKGLERIVLSHGHYDHTGGLKWVLEQTGGITVTAHEAMFTEHRTRLRRDPEGKPLFIGCPYSRRELEGLGAELRLEVRTAELAPGVWFVTAVERKAEQVPHDDNLVIARGEKLAVDPIADDASLLLQTDQGLVLLLGCAHAGVCNILDHLREQMGIERLAAVIGGTHLMFFTAGELAQAIAKFDAFDIGRIGVCHCTGMNAAVKLGAHFGDRFSYAAAGTRAVF